MKYIDIYPDGSCADNGRPNAIGGWSYVIAHQDSTEVISYDFGKLRKGKQTNNRAELEACHQALHWIYHQPQDDNIRYRIFSDSEVVVNGVIGTSGRNANRDIWEQIEGLCSCLLNQKKLTENSFEFIEAHKTDSEDPRHMMNCLADKYAKQGANSLLIRPIY